MLKSKPILICLITTIKRSILFWLFLLVFAFQSENVKATHAMGMDLTYTQVGQDSFMVTLAFYRDCAGVAAPNSATLRISSVSCNFNFTLNAPRVGTGQETTPVCANLLTRCNGGTFPGSEEYIYRRLVVLPAKCTDWTISNQICCRNNAITTINNPGGQNIYVEAKINNNFQNSSPVFSNPPVPFVCSNQTYCFNNGAIDANGDSLVYSLVTPRTGINTTNQVTFLAGFSKFNPITSNPQVSLDSITGDLCMFPTNSSEIAVLAILVQEYRNGILIGSIMRDIQLRILNCPNGNASPTATGIDSTAFYSTKVCANSNLSFQVHSLDPDTSQTVTMTWNQAIASATFNISGGNRPVGTFSWTPNNGDIRSQPYCFTVNVSDDNCPFNASQVFSYCIYVIGVQAIADSIIDPACFGSCDGRSTAQIVNGILPYTYLWDDPLGQTTARAIGLCAGTYNVTGTDSTGCTTTTQVVLTDPEEMTLEMDSIPTLCNGSSDGVGIISNINFGTAPYSIQWEVAAGLQTTDTAFNLAAGYYTVEVMDATNCIALDSVLVVEPLPVVLSIQIIKNVSCNGLNDGEANAITTGGTGPYTYQWDSLSFFQTSDTAFDLLSGTHTVIVTDVNGCSDTASVFISEPPTAITLAMSKVDVTCSGQNTGSATVVPSGGIPPYFYEWSANTGNQTTQTAINLGAGTYSVIVRDSNDCVAFPNIQLTEPLVSMAISPIDSIVECFGYTNGVAGVDISGGTAPYTFLWDAIAGSQTTQYASGLGAGNYKVIVTDSLGCEDSTMVQVTEAGSPIVVLISKSDVSCNNGFDGKAFVTVSGGATPYTIQWDSAAGNQVTDTAFNLYAGIYGVTVTDDFGCQVDTSISVSEPPPLLTLTIIVNHVACAGENTGSASVVVGGGIPPYTYLWSANSGSQTTDTAFGLSAGTYFVTVFDSNDCVTSPGIVINEPSLALSANVTGINASCFNGSDGKAVVVGIGGTGSYTYLWGATAASQTTDTALNLSAGTYNVTVFDSLNCIFDTSVVVSQPGTPLQINLASSPVLCFAGGDGMAYVNITGGTAPYGILWGISAGSQTNDTVFNLPAGFHSVSVNDTNNCGVIDSVEVSGPAEPLLINTFGIDVLCFEGSDGMAIAQGSGGTAPYAFFWGSGAGSQVNDTAFNLSAGNYTVTMFDTNNCDTSFAVVVGQPDRLEDSLIIISNYNGSAIKCFGENNASVTAVPFGGTAPYQFQWDTSASLQTSATAVNLGEGVYSIIITDTNGCTVSDNISIASPQQMGFNLSELKNISCFGGSDGKLVVSGIGGTASYTYQWDTASVIISNSSVLNNVPIGSYRVTLTDTNNCVFDSIFNLNQPPLLQIDSIQTSEVVCKGQFNGNATAHINGGVLPYSYLWEISQGVFQITQTAVNLSAGTYHVTVTDDNDCTISDSVVITEPTQVLVSTSRNDTVCAAEVITISAFGSGGDSSSYKYIWLPQRPDSLPDQTITLTVTTNFTVRAMDARGCLSTPALITIFVRNFDEDTLSVSSAGNLCLGDTGSVSGFHNGPFDNYFIDWNHGVPGFGPHLVIPDTSTYYTMNVRDICGNVISDSILVSVFPNPELYLDSILAEGCEPLSVSFDDTVNTLTNLSYIWRFGDGNISDQKSPVYTYAESGIYNVTLKITSENNCSLNNDKKPSLVIVHPRPNSNFVADPIATDMRNPLITFKNRTSGAVSSNWFFGDGDTSSLLSPEHLYGDTGTYRVTLISTTENGCIDSSALDILIRAYYKIDVPNAFTPKGSSNGGNWRLDPDGNMIFFPYTEKPEAVTAFEMIIFNRWGELIFESKDIYEGWDGFYRGKASPQEVYVFKIALTWENGQTFEKTGDLTLFR